MKGKDYPFTNGPSDEEKCDDSEVSLSISFGERVPYSVLKGVEHKKQTLAARTTDSSEPTGTTTYRKLMESNSMRTTSENPPGQLDLRGNMLSKNTTGKTASLNTEARSKSGPL